MPMVLIVDDDEAVCDLVYDQLAVEGHVCEVASNANDALDKLGKHSFDVALLDIKLPGISGMDLLKTVEKCYEMTAIIMLTAVNDIDTAVEAMRLGASDYIVKPFTCDKLRASIVRALHNRKARAVCAIPTTKDGDYGKNANDRSLSELDSIAYGVDAQLNDLDSHSRMVTEKTVELACWLGLPGEEIEKWAIARDRLYSERDRRIKSMLNKLERNAMAQVMLGLSRLECQSPGIGEAGEG